MQIRRKRNIVSIEHGVELKRSEKVNRKKEKEQGLRNAVKVSIENRVTDLFGVIKSMLYNSEGDVDI